MTLTKMVNGTEVPMTDEEETAVRAEWLAAVDPRAPVLAAIASIESKGLDIPRRAWRDLVIYLNSQGALADTVPLVRAVKAEETAIAALRARL